MKTEVALVLCKNQRVTDNCVKCDKQSMCITIYLNLKKKWLGPSADKTAYKVVTA